MKEDIMKEAQYYLPEAIKAISPLLSDAENNSIRVHIDAGEYEAALGTLCSSRSYALDDLPKEIRMRVFGICSLWTQYRIAEIYDYLIRYVPETDQAMEMAKEWIEVNETALALGNLVWVFEEYNVPISPNIYNKIEEFAFWEDISDEMEYLKLLVKNR